MTPRLPKGPPPDQMRLIPRRQPPLDRCPGQRAVWEAIRDYKAVADGNSPSISEIMARTGLSKTTVAMHLVKLMQRRGPDGQPLVWRNHNDQLEIGGVYQPPEVDSLD